MMLWFYWITILFPCVMCYHVPQAEGSAVCKDRPPCSKKDYFQIHTACDQDGKVTEKNLWIKTPRKDPFRNLGHIPPLPVCFRRRSRISGLNLRYVWREWLELSHCLQVGSESPAPHVTRVSITTTQPPAHRAHLGPTLMGWNVLKTLAYNVLLTGTLLLFLLILWSLFGSS